MKRWHTSVLALAGQARPEVYHAGWRFEAVEPLGVGSGKTALQDLDDAHAAGAAVYTLLSEHVFSAFTNLPTVDWLRLHGIWTSCRDNRYPPAGSNHQKYAVFKSGAGDGAVLGSIDISRTRWDRTAHAHADPRRDPAGKPTHDTGIGVEGPALADLDLSYRERWNDSTRTMGMTPLLPPQPLIATRSATGPGPGTHSVQVLRTFGITTAANGYTWSPRGEFTVWASYLNAIHKASTHIYIEDQYFLPWDFPPRFARAGGAGRDTDIVYQLGEAMKRGVNVVVLTPSNSEDAMRIWQKFQRDIGVNYLLGVRAAGSAGDLVVASLQNGTEDVYVHSKLMLVDDEFLLIGSTNIGQRSMTCDGEVHVGVVDSAGTLALDFRKTLWAEHTGRPPGSLDDPAVAFCHFKADTAASAGHLKPYPVDPLSVYPPGPGSTAPPPGHGKAIRSLIDPYAGPPALA
jgi:phosphatidylserine/phosphatidylglycerophosphate/cardiolipin synthase-like enzyme